MFHKRPIQTYHISPQCVLHKNPDKAFQHSNFEEGLRNIYIDMCWDLLILFYVISNSDIYILKNISKHNNHIY